MSIAGGDASSAFGASDAPCTSAASAPLHVIICCHDPQRLSILQRCIQAVAGELTAIDHLIVVVDHAAGGLVTTLPTATTMAAAPPPRPERSRLQQQVEASISQWCEDIGADDALCRVHVVTHSGPAGLARSRNAGVAKSFALEPAVPSHTDPVTLVFIDDDAIARPGWAQAIRRTLSPTRPGTSTTSLSNATVSSRPSTTTSSHPNSSSNSPSVASSTTQSNDDSSEPAALYGLGGLIHPAFVDRQGHPRPRPRWLPPEHDWIIGCDYEGMPAPGVEIRNPIGAAMALRRHELARVGGFLPNFGRVGANAAGGEETELFMRIAAYQASASDREQEDGQQSVVAQPHVDRVDTEQSGRTPKVVRCAGFEVDHHVPPTRTTPRYYLRRAWAEGRSKALIGSATYANTSSEQQHLVATLPRLWWRHMRTNPARLITSMMVVVATGGGFVTGRACSSPPRAEHSSLSGSQQTESSTPDISASAPSASVIMCTDGTSSHLPNAIDSLRSHLPSSAELIIVDNCQSAELSDNLAALCRDTHRGRALDQSTDRRDAPGQSSSRTKTPGKTVTVADESSIHIVRAEHRGLSRARNVGIQAASAPIILFTDDDVALTDQWYEQLIAPFSDPQVWCTTGRTVSADDSSDSARYFEQAVSFDKGQQPIRWDRRGGRQLPADTSTTDASTTDSSMPGTLIPVTLRPPLYPLPAGCFGSGNNMAFRASALHALGGFSEDLGAGTRTRGGEDLDIFRRIIVAGGEIHYTPHALLQHHHRDTVEQLRRQLFGYGTGMAAQLARAALDDPRTGLRIAVSVPRAMGILWRRRSAPVATPTSTTIGRETGSTAVNSDSIAPVPASALPDSESAVSAPAALPLTLRLREICGYVCGVPLLLAERGVQVARQLGLVGTRQRVRPRLAHRPPSTPPPSSTDEKGH